MLHYFFSQPLMVVIPQSCLLLCSWGLIALLIKSGAQTLIQGITHLKRLHSIPCHRCAYFTGHYQLKCTVHPCEALTEQAINCPDCMICNTPTETARVPLWKCNSAHQPLQEASHADSTTAQQPHLPQSGSYQPTLL
ncbi:hypothetical protein [Acaryochloris thomasi]|uniref:hypothetical protein n=1 Tax=Acaryochloris thomasi TaxID=2929456 RepID=UPI0018F1B80B